MLVVGILIIAIDQPRVSAVESIFGGWAMLSPEYQSLLQELMFGYALALTGIGFVVASVIKSKSKASICSYCNFVAMSETELNAHLAKEHLDKSPYKCEHCDFVGFTEDIIQNHYKDKHPDAKKWKWGLKHNSKQVPPMKPKRDFKKSPTLKGIIIGIIAVSIIYGSIWGISYQAFVMTSDGMAPTINKYDLVRYDKTPFHEIQVNDIIFYSDNDKVRTNKVIHVDSSKIPRTLIAKNEVSDTPNYVTESQYIGKLTSVTEGAGAITQILIFPINIIIMITAFVIPIVIMKIRERKK